MEENNNWENAPLILALQTGDIEKAKFLVASGADIHAQSRSDESLIFYAIDSGRPEILKWTVDLGIGVQEIDCFDNAPLCKAAEIGNIEMIDILLGAGADINRRNKYKDNALEHAKNRETALKLVERGAEADRISSEARRVLLGFRRDPDINELDVSAKDFRNEHNPRFGEQNPQLMDIPFWKGMIRAGVNAYQGGVRYGSDMFQYSPVWCADRFGQTLTFLPDGRIILTGGEHEDSSDPDFYIYNDVFVQNQDGRIDIFGYPEDIFRPPISIRRR